MKRIIGSLSILLIGCACVRENSSKVRPSDDQVWQMIIEMTGVTNSIAFQKLEDESKRTVLKELKVRGASHRQLERLTGVGRGLIQKL